MKSLLRTLRKSLTRTPSRMRSPGALKLEFLEARDVPATIYVDDSLVAGSPLASLGGRVTLDRDSSGSLTVGDQVTFALGETGETVNLTFGQAATGGDVGTAFGIGSPGGAIPAAIAFASSGDTIQVARGNYALSTAISINKSLTLLGAQAGVDPRLTTGTTRVIDSASESVIDAGSAGGAFSIAASNVTIDGFNIKASTTSTTALIDSQGSTAYSNAQIRNNIVHNASTAGGVKGIRLTAVSGSTVEYNHIFSVADAGIELGATNAGASTDGIVRFNEVHDLGSDGTNSAIYAFAVGSSATTINITVQGNLVYNHHGNDAIKIGSKNGEDANLNGGMVIDNIVHNTDQDGITINASNTTVRGNEIYNCGSTNAAIYIERATSGVTIENNYLHDNSAGRAAVLVGFSGRPASPTGMVVRFNSIVNNTNNFIFFRDNTGGTATLNASFNWFGSSAQATVTASVKSTAGSTPTANRIDFTPWLNLGTDTDTNAPGFQPDFSSLTVAPSTVSLQTGGSGRIQEAIDQASTGATITVINGTYVEDVHVNKDVTVNVSGTVAGKVSSTAAGKIVTTGTLSLGDGSSTGVGLSGALNVGAQTVTLLDSDGAVLSGTTTLAGGTLTAANGISSGSAATLTGTGTVLAAVTTAGTVSPGGSAVGTLAVGNLILNGTTQFAADIDTATSDALTVTGSVSLGGAVLNLTVLGSPAVGQALTLIDNDGSDAVSGTFDGLPEGSFVSAGGAFFQITYAGGTNGNDVVLTAVTGVSITANDPTAAETVSPAMADNGQFTVTRTGPTTAPLTVFYTVSGTATNGTDYTTLTGSVIIPAGQSSATIDVTVLNDALTEGNETVVVTLTPDAGYALASGAMATVTIADNEAEVSVTANDPGAAETVSPVSPNGGQFTITRTGDTTAPLTVFFTVSGTATNGTDYGTLPGSVVIPAGQSSVTIDIIPINDALTEGDETVTLTLFADPSYTLATPMAATVTIADNEPEISITANDPSASETTAPTPNGGQFTVTRTGDTSAPLTVFYTVSGTATIGTDYATLSGSVTIPAGQSSATIDVAVLNDPTAEGNETVILTLSSDASYTLADPTAATVTITDNEPGASVTPATTSEDTQSTSGLVVTATGPGAGSVTHFKVTNIQNGTLFLADGTTPVNDGDFITAADGAAGLKFTPAADIFGSGSFDVQAALSASDAGLDGSPATATVTVDPVNDAPTFGPVSNLTVDQDSGPQSVSGFATGFVPGPANEFGQVVLAYEIVSNSNPGLFSSGPSVAPDGTLTYTTAPGASGTATIGILVRDDGGTANGGVDVSGVQTFTIGVTQIVVAPPMALFTPEPARTTLALGGAAGTPSAAQLINTSTGAVLTRTVPFAGFLGGLTVTSGDVNGDGTDDLVVVAGAGGNGHVKVFDGKTGALIQSFLAFPGFNGAVSVAAGDVDGDGFDDIIVGAGPGSAGGHVKVFSGADGSLLRSFLAYDAGFVGGVSVAVGDTNKDGFADIVTGTAAGSSHVKVFDGQTGAVLASFLAYSNFNGGVQVAAGDVDGDGAVDLITLASGTAHTKVFGPTGAERASLIAFPAGFSNVQVASVDANGDGISDVVTTGLTGATVQRRAFGGSPLAEIAALFALPPDALGAIDVG